MYILIFNLLSYDNMGTKVKIEVKMYIIANNFFMIIFREKNVYNRKDAEENSTFNIPNKNCCISITF